jgi:hypothetical protein
LNEDAASFDILDRFWGPSVGWAFNYDILDRIKDLIEETRHLQLDQFVVGFRNEPIDVWDECVKLMRAYDFRFGTRDDGFLGIYRLRLSDIRDLQDAGGSPVDAHDDILQWESGSSSALDTFVVDVGALPWTRGRRVTVNMEGVSRRTDQLASGREHFLDVPYINEDGAEDILTTLGSQAVLRYHHMPRLTLRVWDRDLYFPFEPDYHVGSTIALKDLPLQDAWLVANDGTRTKVVEGLTQFVGQIMARTWNLQDGSVTLQILLTNYSLRNVIRLRGHSLLIKEVVPGAGTGNVLTTYANSVHGNALNDAQYFKVGDQVRLIDRNMKFIDSVTYHITAVGSDSVTISPYPTKELFEGDMVRLASTRFYDNGAHYAGYPRPWVAMSSTTNRVSNDPFAPPSSVFGDIYSG